MKRNLTMILLCCAVMLTALAACGDNDRFNSAGGAASSGPVSSREEAVSSEPTSSSEKEGSSSSPVSSSPSSSIRSRIHTLNVMYVASSRGDGAMYFSHPEEEGTALLLRLPEDLRDENGEAITREDLNSGDILRLYFPEGFAIYTMWPASPSCDPNRAEVLKRGKPADADKYQSTVDSFFQPDPLHIPTLQFTHIDGIAARGGTLGADEGSYEWDCTDENDEPVHLSQEADHPLLRWDLPKIPMSGPFPLELHVETGVLEWEVRRWDVSQKGDESLPEGELVMPTPGTVTTEGIEPPEEDAPTPPLRAVVEDAAPGQVYRVTAKWEKGWVCYDFELYQDEG